MTGCAPEPLLRWDNDLEVWFTEAPVCALWQGILIEVGEGFPTDLATIPWPLIAVPGAARYGNHNRAAVIHDYLYFMRGQVGQGVQMSRAEADRLFLDIMLEDGVAGWKAWLMYLAVRVSPTNWGKFDGV
jgi:hypothetical protein